MTSSVNEEDQNKFHRSAKHNPRDKKRIYIKAKLREIENNYNKNQLLPKNKKDEDNARRQICQLVGKNYGSVAVRQSKN